MVALAGLIVLLVPVAGLAAFAAASVRWGVDSREGSRDPRRPDRHVGIS